MRNNVYRIIATVFGIGYSPIAPGTMGSLAGLGLCIALHKYTILYILVFFTLFFIGGMVSKRVEEEEKKKDPSFVVIDEFACIFIAFLFLPIRPSVLITGFAIYRFIDIVKIFPLRRLERQTGAWAIMLDDLAAGIYANFILQVLISLRIL